MTDTERFIEEKIIKAKRIVVNALDGTKPPYDKERRYIRYTELSEIIHKLYDDFERSDYEDFKTYLLKEAGL